MPLAAQDICSLARQDAKCPGFTVQSGQFLNMILGDLCRTYDFELAAKTTYFNFQPGLIAPVGNSLFGSGPYPLPADFLRVKDDKSAFWTLQGVPYPLIPCDLSEFDMLVQQAGTQSYPYIIATDMSLGDEAQNNDSTPVAYFYSPPSGAYPVTIRYYAQMADIASPETSSTVPWFPHQGYLRKAVAACLMGTSGDDREAAWMSESDAMLRKYLMLKDNRSNRASTVKLDRRRFGYAYSGLRNTKTIGWVVAIALLGGNVVASTLSGFGGYDAHGRSAAGAQRLHAAVEEGQQGQGQRNQPRSES